VFSLPVTCPIVTSSTTRHKAGGRPSLRNHPLHIIHSAGNFTNGAILFFTKRFEDLGHFVEPKICGIPRNQLVFRHHLAKTLFRRTNLSGPRIQDNQVNIKAFPTWRNAGTSSTVYRSISIFPFVDWANPSIGGFLGERSAKWWNDTV
jgi:hypothetical protein